MPQLPGPTSTESSLLDPWIADLNQTFPELSEFLRSRAITTDRRYVDARRDGLSANWARLDQLRYIALRDREGDANPFQEMHLLPPWLASVPVSSPPLSVRLANGLKREGFLTIGEALTLGQEGLAGIRNLGRQSISEFLSFVSQAAADHRHLPPPMPLWIESSTSSIADSASAPEHLPERSDTPPSPSAEALGVRTTLREEVDDALASLNSRDGVVVARWLGIDGDEPDTLEAIGEALGVTRERVRQLRNRAWDQVVAHGRWRAHLHSSLASLLRDRRAPLYLDLAAADDPWLAGFQGSIPGLARLITEATEGAFATWQLQDRWIASRCQATLWSSLQTSARDVMEKHLDKEISPSEASTLIEGLALAEGAADLSQPLQDAILEELHFTRPGEGGQRLAAIGKGLRHHAAAILKSSSRPLAMSEILDRLGQRGRPIDDSYASRNVIRSALATAGALLFGRSVYGLPEHLPWSADDAENLASDLEGIVAAGPHDRQWHSSELAREILVTRPDLEDEIDAFLVNSVLSLYSSLTYLGRLVWTAESDPSAIQDRLDIAALCETALVEAGGPLTKQELRQAIERVRGLNQTFLPQVSDRVIRVSHGKWGLVDRDVGVPASGQADALDALESLLKRRQKGQHLSEIFGGLRDTGFEPDPEMTPDELMGIAQRDPRFRVGRGQIVGLSDWEDLRRVSLGAAFDRLRASWDGPLPGDVFHQRFCHLIERNIPRSQFASRAVMSGFVFNEPQGSWDLAKTLDDEVDEFE